MGGKIRLFVGSVGRWKTVPDPIWHRVFIVGLAIPPTACSIAFHNYVDIAKTSSTLWDLACSPSRFIARSKRFLNVVAKNAETNVSTF